MLLKRLYEYSERLEQSDDPRKRPAPPLHAKTRIDWLIDIDLDGTLLGFVEQQADPQGKRRGILRDAPSVVRTSGVKPALLADNTKYVLGWDPGAMKPERVKQCQASFLELVRKCHAATKVSSVNAVVSFLEGNKRSPVEKPAEMKPGDNLTFRVGEELIVDNEEVQAWWSRTGMDEKYLTDGTCLLTGIKGKVLKVLPLPIKGIPGDQAEYYMISANSSVFESYGLSAAQIAPLSITAAERFSKALNHLLRNERTHLRFGRIVYVFWTGEEQEFDWCQPLCAPDGKHVEMLLKSPFSAKGVPVIDTAAFYAAAFSAAGSRIVVRDWIETTVGNVKANLARWFRLMKLHDFKGDPRYYGIYPLAACLYHDANRDMVANVPRALISCALNGTRLPDWLLFQAIKRNRAEQGMTRPRATLIKMILHNHYSNPEEDYMTVLVMNKPTEWDQPAYDAYLCGRLLAVLDGIQGIAIPGAKATIIDRYHGTASSAPATVFGTLLRGAQNHLAKFRMEKKGLYIFFSKQLEEIIGGLTRGFPTTLSLQQQSMFSLGFYHQRAWRKSDSAASNGHVAQEDN